MQSRSGNSGCLSHPIWGVIGATASVLALLFAIFVWRVPNYHALTSDSGISTPAGTVTNVPTPVPTPSNFKQNVVKGKYEIALDVLLNWWLIWLIIGSAPTIIIWVLVSIIGEKSSARAFPLVLIGNVGSFGAVYLLNFLLSSPADLWINIIVAVLGSFILLLLIGVMNLNN